MQYFIDFDRTIFDTPAFKKMLGQEFSIKNVSSDIREIFSKKEEEKVEEVVTRHGLMHTIATFFATGRTGFSPEELRHYLYPDVPAFLETHGDEVTIVTYGVEAFIMAKVTSALAGFPVKNIVYTSEKKGHVMQKLCPKDSEKGSCSFIDDAVFQLVSVAKHCPQIALFEMRRDDGKGDGRWPVVRSLVDLPS